MIAGSRSKRKAKPAQDGRDFVALARQYAEDVTAGLIPACRYVRLACQRHLDGLARQDDPAYPYRLDEKKATKICRFTELMPHVKGKWARARERITITAWWAFVLVNVWGWVRKSDGLRRYREVYIEVPRKNAKSTGTAAAGNFMLTADDEHGAEIYSGATTEKQAWEVFGPARLMALGTADFLEKFGVTVGAKNLHVLETASKFEPLIGKPGDGASPSFAIHDEFHEHPTSEQRDTMLTGMGAREQPIDWTITTAGFDTSSPCYALRQTAIEVLEGKVEQDTLFAIIYTIDEGVDWTSPEALRMANPNMGVSVFEEFLLTEQRKAVNDPRLQATFKTKHLNVWVTAASPYFNSELWARLADPSLSREQFRQQECMKGLDLASKIDLCADITLFWRDYADPPAGWKPGRHYFVFSRFYVPEMRTQAPELRKYAGWAEQGYIIATPGDITDYDYIEADIRRDAQEHVVLTIGADPHNATQLITHLQADIGSNRVIEVPQTVAHLSEPMKELQALIVDGRIHHDGNPCYAWQIGNVTAQEDRNQNVFPRKERPEQKIDGAVATIIALGRALALAKAPEYSIMFVG